MVISYDDNSFYYIVLVFPAFQNLLYNNNHLCSNFAGKETMTPFCNILWWWLFLLLYSHIFEFSEVNIIIINNTSNNNNNYYYIFNIFYDC